MENKLKLWEAARTPSCRKVGVYLAEKGLQIERVNVDFSRREHKTPEYLAKNPIGKVPLLQIGESTFLPESSAIVEYLEERFPTPTMLGTSAEQRAQVRASERIAGDIFTRHAFILLNSHPSIPKTRPDVTQYPDTAKALRPSFDQLLNQIDIRIGTHSFVAGEFVSIADCALFAIMEVSTQRFGYEIPDSLPRLQRWFQNFSQRPSVKLN